MRIRAPIHLIGVLSFCVGLAGCAVPVVPRSVSVDQIGENIRAIPAWYHFTMHGVAFFKDKLYVSTNIGLLVVNGARPEILYKWFPRDDVVVGPWVDAANDALWIHHAHDNYLRRFDGTSWRLVRPPVYRPGSSITIFRGFGSPTSFRLVAGGHLWRYQAGEPSWVLEPRPPAPKYGETEAIAPIGATMLHVVREEPMWIWPSRYAVYDRENNWARQILAEKMEFGDAVTTPEGAYVRARDGRLFSIGSKKVQILETPGRCEAIAQTSAGRLLASFADRGIFLLDNGRWNLKAAYPYGKEEGEHRAYLAESNGQIAYLTSAMPQSKGDKTVYSGTVALWLLRAGKLERVIVN